MCLLLLYESKDNEDIKGYMQELNDMEKFNTCNKKYVHLT